MKKELIKNLSIFFLVFFGLALFFGLFNESAKKQKVGLDALVNRVNNEEVSALEVEGEKITLVLKSGEKEIVRKEENDSLASLLADLQVDPQKLNEVSVTIKETSAWSYFLTIILPFLLPLLIIGLFLVYMMRGVSGMNSRAICSKLASASTTPGTA